METVKIEDPIYGKVQISSPVLVELINSSSMQRLKRINQFGIPDEFYHKINFSRFKHCVGVMILLKSLGASEEEQVAGLLHDVSHMAFSHVYDWVMGRGKDEDQQDKGHTSFILNSEIPDILGKYGFSAQRITDYHHFTILEKDAPDLCADRVDYSLKEILKERAIKIFKGLTVIEGQIVCKNLETAALFGREFLKLQTKHWGEYEAVSRYYIFSNVLRRALEQGVLSSKDFLVDDQYVLDKLKACSDIQIIKVLNFLRQKHLPKVNGRKSAIVYKKFRYIDPLYIFGKGLKRLSDTDGDFKKMVDNAKDKNSAGIKVTDLI